MKWKMDCQVARVATVACLRVELARDGSSSNTEPREMPKKGRSKAEDPKKAAKAAAKAAALEAERAVRDALKAALQTENPLAALPGAFTAYNRNGLHCAVEHHTPTTLPPADLASISRMLRASGADGSAQRRLGDDDARLLLVRAVAADAADEPTQPASPAKDEAAPASPAASPAKEPGEDAAADELKPGAVAAFVLFGYEIEAEALLLRLHELQVAPVARRKGLGKFAVMLSEMVARKAAMGGASLVLKKDNADALSFFAACKYTIDPLSPSKIDPTSEDEKPEIFSKLWDGATQAAQAKRGAEAAARIAREAAGGKRGAIIGNRSIDECGAN